ncbi:MAG: 50S ribosomal protein L11 methyltransferase [Oscillospiraceae bacterium]|nr:50S ribosomal protein L11 methyltransferase [Oscillospiraceae bacterium]
MDWLEITIPTTSPEMDPLLSALDDLGVDGVVINDEAVVNDFLENGKKYWDYIDEDFLRSMRGTCNVQFYLEDTPGGQKELKRLRAALPGRSFQVRRVRDEDWENNWKQYYVPIEIGEKLVIVPEWLSVPDSGRIQLRLDPGLIFGTGSHATTRMCLAAMEKAPAREVLDLGCGSGILSIAALLLGAEHAVGVDIDEKAPGVVRQNAALNGIGSDRLAVYAGDILSDIKLKAKIAEKRYDLILANIVADVIIALAPAVPGYLAQDGLFICSGIIDGREDEVRAALVQAGLTPLEHKKIDNWNCFLAKGAK